MPTELFCVVAGFPKNDVSSQLESYAGFFGEIYCQFPVVNFIRILSWLMKKKRD